MISTVILCLGFLVLGFFGRNILERIALARFTLEYQKRITPTDIDLDRLCTGVHLWMNTTVMTKEGRRGTKVCNICGLVNGTDKMATPEAIDAIEENLRLQEIDNRLSKEFVDTEYDDLIAYLKGDMERGLTFETIAFIHNAGTTFSNRLKLYKESKFEEVSKQMEKSNA